MIGCDLGSNTIRFVQIDCKTKHRIKEFEKIVKTGKNLYKTKKISDESIKNILNAIESASKIMNFKKHKTKCVTTQALRVAKNSNEVIEKIKKLYGLNFEIIDGKQEAIYTLFGVKTSLQSLGINYDNFAMFDLGGGSTELSYIKDNNMDTKSFSFGILNMDEKYGDKIEVEIKKELHDVSSFVNKHKKPDFLVATAGTPTTVCAFLQGIDYNSYDYKKVNGKALHVEDFLKAYKQLLELNDKEREKFCGTGRSELIKIGIIIVVKLMKIMGFEKCLVIDDGLREGVALSLCNERSNDVKSYHF